MYKTCYPCADTTLGSGTLDALSFKTALLLALVSAKCAGELASPSVSLSCLLLNEVSSFVLLRPNPAFLPKNIGSSFQSSDIVLKTFHPLLHSSGGAASFDQRCQGPRPLLNSIYLDCYVRVLLSLHSARLGTNAGCKSSIYTGCGRFYGFAKRYISGRHLHGGVMMFIIRWIYASYDYLTDVMDDILHNNWREMMPLVSLIFSALFILFGTVVIQAFSDSSEDKQTKPKGKDGLKTENGPPKKSFVEVTELTDITYTSNLVKLRPGHMNVVLVLTDASKNILLSKFAKEVYSFTGSVTLHFSFLNMEKHSEWMHSLLEYAQDAMRRDAHDDHQAANRRADYTGYVLALNGHKKYLCLFKPVYTGEDPDAKSSEDESGVGMGGAGAGATGSSRSRPGSRDDHPPPRKSNRSRSVSTLQIHHKLDRLGLWMERLMEGTLPRYYIPAWPGLDKITPGK
ncbi:DnaJ subfamily C member 16 [Merluccius polli]|uniref:DnaJ subfamily C member 16 n=1 Tax=Merluccius polli TaxID=89951 RepID=A0AA47M381_MERPO|nr:DnaJ subfamily C member 16 [Merluccius polli]